MVTEVPHGNGCQSGTLLEPQATPTFFFSRNANPRYTCFPETGDVIWRIRFQNCCNKNRMANMIWPEMLVKRKCLNKTL